MSKPAHDNPRPLITIGITCFNADHTIERAIIGALEQDYQNVEIIIVDDFSTDDSVSVVQRVIDNNPQARLIVHKKNFGVATARNTIINQASGAFIVFFDDDDISSPTRVKTQYNRIITYQKATKCNLVACWASGYKLYDNGYRAFFDAIGSRSIIPTGRDIVQYQLYMGRKKGVFFGSGTPSCSLMAETSTFKLVGQYDPKMLRIEDTDFALRLAKEGAHFIGCPEQLVVQSASTGMDKTPEIGYRTELLVIEKHRDLFDSPARYKYGKLWAKLRYNHFSRKRIHTAASLLLLFIKYPCWTWEQFWRSAPKRILHEYKMKQTTLVK